MTKWEGFYVVGIGRHAVNHLLPAIEENNQKIYALISQHNFQNFKGNFEVKDSIDSIKFDSSRRACVLISSAPAQHFSQIMKSLALGFDVLVEKPAFVSVEDAQAAMDLAKNKDCILAEAFMFKYSGLYGRAIEYWNKKNYIKINLNFQFRNCPILFEMIKK